MQSVSELDGAVQKACIESARSGIHGKKLIYYLITAIGTEAFNNMILMDLINDEGKAELQVAVIHRDIRQYCHFFIINHRRSGYMLLKSRQVI